jgi:hypothetical protein
MLEKNKQEASNISGSLVQQANGDIHNHGLGYNDVKDICRDVIRQELAIVTREASDTLNKEISTFENQFVERLEKLENPQVIDKLKTPKLQFSLHDTMKEYAKADDLDTKEELVDLLIERLKVDEHSTEQYLIDESITILPNLSKHQAYFLGALTLRKVINQGYSFMVDGNLARRAMLYEFLNEISNLDIHYLRLTNCCYDMPGTKQYVPFIDFMKPNYDLLFRHHITEQIYNTFLRDNPNTPLVDGKQIVYKKGGTDELYLLYSSKDYLIEKLKKEGKLDKLSEIEPLINLFPPYTDGDIKEHLISLNTNWQKAFDNLNNEEITQIDLTPIGTYIGRRIVRKVTKQETLPLEDFYKIAT